MWFGLKKEIHTHTHLKFLDCIVDFDQKDRAQGSDSSDQSTGLCRECS